MNLAIVSLVFAAEEKGALSFDGTRGTKRKRAAFLQALEQTASVSMACRAAGLPRRTAYNWRRDDAEFSKAWDAAHDVGTEALRDEVIRRAFHGTLKPVFQGGKRVGSVRERSDVLLMFELKRRDPTYRDRYEVTGANGGPIRHTHDVHLYIPGNGRDIATLDGETGELVTAAGDRDPAAEGTAGAVLILPG